MQKGICFLIFVPVFYSFFANLATFFHSGGYAKLGENNTLKQEVGSDYYDKPEYFHFINPYFKKYRDSICPDEPLLYMTHGHICQFAHENPLFDEQPESPDSPP